MPRITLGKDKWYLNIEPRLLFGLLNEWPLPLLSSYISRNERDLFATSMVRWSVTYSRTICNCQEKAPRFLLGCLVMFIDFSKSLVVT